MTYAVYPTSMPPAPTFSPDPGVVNSGFGSSLVSVTYAVVTDLGASNPSQLNLPTGIVSTTTTGQLWPLKA